MTHIYIYVSKLNSIGSDNGLSPGRHQTIICTNAGILLIRNVATNFREILIKRNSYIFIQENAFENIVCEIAAILSRPRCVKDQGPRIFLKISRNVKNTLISRYGKSQKLLNIERSRNVNECIWLQKCSQVKSLGHKSVFLLPVSVLVPVWLYQTIYLMTPTKHAVYDSMSILSLPNKVVKNYFTFTHFIVIQI